MQKIRVGICIEDEEYSNRFTSYLMNHHQNKLELHVYTGCDQLLAVDTSQLDVLVISDELTDEITKRRCPVIFLAEGEECLKEIEGYEGVYVVEMYQEVNKIVDEILLHVGDEIRQVKQNGVITRKTKVYSVYSLSENEFQLPFAVTLASIISEKKRVLLVDLQENSGLKQLIKEEYVQGLEELLIMSENGRYSSNRVNACIGHLDKLDYVYPIDNTESLCEMNAETYLNLVKMITQEMDYEIILLNLGARFVGFYELLNYCEDVYLMQKKGGLCQWREFEFIEEINKRGYKSLLEKMTKVELPILSGSTTSCERLIEQWKWNEFGDMIRSITPEVYCAS